MSKKKRGPTKEERRAEMFEKLVRLRHLERFSIEECARKLNVSYRTIQYWLADPLYQETVVRLREEWKEATETGVSELGHLALKTLRDVMESPRTKSDIARVQAASKIVEVLGIGMKTEEEKQDDRGELERMMKIIAARPTTVNIFGKPEAVLEPEPGGFLPEPIQRKVDVEEMLQNMSRSKSRVVDADPIDR